MTPLSTIDTDELVTATGGLSIPPNRPDPAPGFPRPRPLPNPLPDPTPWPPSPGPYNPNGPILGASR